MTLISKILAVGFIHALFFAAYPDTGPAGDIYLWVSPLVWCGFILFVNTSTALLRFFSGTAGLLVNAAAFSLMALSLAATMPQQSGGTVLEKIRRGKFPAAPDMRRGLKRFGVDLKTAGAPAAPELEKAARELLKGK